MSSILIRNVSVEIKNTLQRKAKLNGLSLQEFLIEELTRLANNYEAIKLSVRINRSDLPKIKASTIVDAIDSERKRER
jgi:RNA-binding protein YhbY